MNEDWDNLIILDACRFDMFEEQNSIDGELEPRVSQGSWTPEFLRRNFAGGEFNDTVYVTGNPQVNVHLSDEFYHIVSAWEDRWDGDLNTVPPEAMAEATLEAYKRYPNKRIISHFVQPHYPFIGEFGQTKLDDHAGVELSKRIVTGGEAIADRENIWDKLRKGEVNRDEVWTAYRENLSLTLPLVERLVANFDDRTIITSDHGNMIGEYADSFPLPIRLYGHPGGVYSEQLVKVPWLIREGRSRKELVDELEHEEVQAPTSDTVTERLRDLGYHQ